MENRKAGGEGMGRSMWHPQNEMFFLFSFFNKEESRQVHYLFIIILAIYLLI